MKVFIAQFCPALLQPHGLQPTRLLCPWDFPGKNTGVGCHFLFQGIFLTQGLNSYLLQEIMHWQAGSLPLSHLGSPKKKNGKGRGNSLVAYRLGLCAFIAEGRRSLVRELRSHKLCTKKKKRNWKGRKFYTLHNMDET